MSDQVGSALRDYTQAVDEAQMPISVDEILERADVVDMAAPADIDTSWRTRPGALAGLAAAIAAVLVLVAFVMGNLPSSQEDPSIVALDQPSTFERPDPALVRPLGELVGGRTYELAVDGSFGYFAEHGVEVTVPEGWEGGRWFVGKFVDDRLAVAIAAMEVGELFGHPCDWNGTLFDPGPNIDDLANALTGIPLRNASTPLTVTFDGYDARYVEWSVPDDIDFASCDGDTGRYAYEDTRAGDESYFESWVSPTGGHLSQQAPGQVDQLWIVDVEGTRLVIDVSRTPIATPEDLADLERAFESLEIVVRDDG